MSISQFTGCDAEAVDVWPRVVALQVLRKKTFTYEIYFNSLLIPAWRTVTLELWLQNSISKTCGWRAETVLSQYYIMLDCGGMQYCTCCSTSGLSQGSTLTLYWGKSWTTLALWPWRIRLKMLRRPDMQTSPSAEINTWLAFTLLHIAKDS